MMRFLAMLAVIVMPMLLSGQTSSPSPNGSAPAGRDAPLTQQSLITVLMNDVDAQRVTIGDAVKVRTYSSLSLPGSFRVPPGSVMTGHVVEVSRLGKGSLESHLAVVFDEVHTASGQTVAVHMGVAGLSAAPHVRGLESQEEVGADTPTPFQGARSTGVFVDPSGQRSNTRTAGGTGGTRVTRELPGRTPGPQSDNGISSTAAPNSGNQGIAVASIGSTIPGIDLRPNSAARSVLVSTSKNIALRGGTSLVLLPIEDHLP